MVWGHVLSKDIVCRPSDRLHQLVIKDLARAEDDRGPERGRSGSVSRCLIDNTGLPLVLQKI
jgi:hypothetical protein